jgi:hypothetical protein
MLMTPSEYFHELVEPAINEFESYPSSIRHAYTACVLAYHFADAVHIAKAKSKSSARRSLANIAPAFWIVEGVANMVKHIEVTGTKVKPKIGDTHIGRAAAFTDGTLFSDGTSTSDADDVVKTKDDIGRYIDMRWCVREARRAIEAYLSTL